MSECTPKERPAGPAMKCDECFAPGGVTLAARGDGHKIFLCSDCRRLRDSFGRLVREAWLVWAREQPDAKPSWLVPYDELPERDKEVDRRIGQAILTHLYLTMGFRPFRKISTPEIFNE